MVYSNTNIEFYPFVLVDFNKNLIVGFSTIRTTAFKKSAIGLSSVFISVSYFFFSVNAIKERILLFILLDKKYFLDYNAVSY